jgi:L-fucose isomerase-like protein
LGDAYRHLAEFKQISLPILIVTSEFGTLSMWDWEIASYLRGEGVETIAPYNLGQTQLLCRALSVRRILKQTKLLVFQDNPGKGFQASIFKRFYWWEDECTQRMVDRFGISLEKKSFKELATRAKGISDKDAETVIENREICTEGVSTRALNSAVKLYLAVKQELDQDKSIRGVGINCLNESHFSDTTPCLAWNLLYKEQGLLWGCEADTMSILSEFILHKSLGAPVMMTNLYPFLMGQAALKHEHIPEFPQVSEPEDCILVAHCGYLGVVPESFSTQWTLRPKVLAIVDDNATAIDARLPLGKITLAKLSPTLDRLTVIVGNLEGYAQYPDSHCLNGAVLRIKDGRRSIKRLDSHHYVILTGDHLESIGLIAKVFDLQVEEI